MGRRIPRPVLATLALPALAAAASMDTAASIAGVDVLARCQALVIATPAAAPSQTPTFLQLDAKDLPFDVSTALAARSLAWTALSDVMRIGVLWAHGYVLPGGGNGALVKVYTACNDPTNAALDEVNGRFMDDIALPSDMFKAAACEQNTCGNFFQATNDKCSSRVASTLLCAVDATSLPTSNESFWSDAGNDSTAVPYPQVYTHALPVTNANTTNANTKLLASLALVSIHMASTTTGSPRCGNTGDAIVPCIALASATKSQQFCRPKVDAVRLQAYLDNVETHLAKAAVAATNTTTTDSSNSSGLSTGAIAGIVGGAVVVLGLVSLYFFCMKKACRTSGKNDPEDRGRKSPTGAASRGGNNSSGGTNGTGTKGNRPKALHRQGTSNNFPLMDSRDNDTVFSTDYVGGESIVDEDSRQRPFSHRLLQSQEGTIRSRHSSMSDSSHSMYGKTDDAYCAESEVIRDFVKDPQIKIRSIPYEELTVLRILSKGSYGEVYLGQLETRHIAMKRLLPEKKHLTKSIEQFMGEIQIMCHMEHPNIVKFVGVSWDCLQNISVIVEYMDNGDLSEVLAKSKLKFTWPKEKISIAMDVAEGLMYLHMLRPVIVHRDLKSKNILLDKSNKAKLSDFGVSRRTTVNETMTSGVGTLLWTAPEIIEGRKYSEKADIFSLGVVLSEIDTCEEPYAEVKNLETKERLPGMQIVQMVRLGQLQISFRPDCPPKLRELAQQCTALDPDKRPTSMQVAYELKSFIAPSLRPASSA